MAISEPRNTLNTRKEGGHRFARIKRTWIDLSSVESRREGIRMYRPGRKILRFVPWLLGVFAFLPWWKWLKCEVAMADQILPGVDLDAIVKHTRFVTIYTGNGSAKSKYTIRVRQADDSCWIVKLGNTPEAGDAIRHEAEILDLLKAQVPHFSGRVPVLIGKVGGAGAWTWSVQTSLPSGTSDNRFSDVHRQFLSALQEATRREGKVLVHGDFAPWNMSVIDGQLYVYDWEDAHWGAVDEDEKWFKKQVRGLLGVVERS